MPDNTNLEDDLFEAALLTPPGPERAAFLEGKCRSDPGLRARIEMMLEGHLDAKNFLETVPDRVAPVRKTASPETGSLEQVGSHIGPYKVLQKLGEGGCGFVYLAEQNQPVRRRVALKVIKLGMDTRSVIARFEAERQALALMDHPNIAKVFDAGTTETGRPYFVMELVRGIRISEYCDQNNLPTDQRLSLFIQVCHAIQHAHQKGIIHRDIKPSNILITLHDGVPVPKVIDFGIAKATCDQRLTDKTIFTAFEQFIGTPAYMSPEQAEMSGLDIDTRSDIYSLGVLLYELLTGSTPFNARELMASGLDAMRKTIREKEAVRPSTKLATLQGQELATTAQRRSAEASKLVHQLKGDLDWIIMKCLEKDRTRRYETANGLAADLKRHMINEPVIARPPSTAYRFQKAFRRNKLVFIAATAVAAALVAGIAVSAWLATVAMRARNEAQNNLQKVVVAEGRVKQERDHAIAAAGTLRNQVYVGDIGLAHKAIEEGNLGRARALLGNHRPGSGEADLRGFEWRFLKSRLKGEYQADLGLYSGFLSNVALSPDGQFVALTRSDPQRLEVIHLPSGTVAKSIAIEQQVEPLIYSPSGNFLMGASSDKVIRWDTRTWEARDAVELTFPLVFSHRTAEEIFVACHGDHLQVWSATKWQKIDDLRNAPSAGRLLDPAYGAIMDFRFSIGSLAISSEDNVVYLAGARGIRRWDLLQRNELAPFAIEGMECLATSDAGHLAGSEHSGKVHLINPETGQILHTFSSHLAWISALKFSRDGSRLVSASADRKLVIYDPVKRLAVRELLGHETEVWALDISAEGKTLVSGAGYGGHVLAWSLADTAGGGMDLAEAKRCALLDDGRILIHRPSARDLEYYDPIKGRIEPAHTQRFVQALTTSQTELFEVSPNAKWAVSWDGTVWNVFTGGRAHTLSVQSNKITGVAFSPDSRFVVTTGNDFEARLWRTDHWTSEALSQERVRDAGYRLHAIGFSANSQRVALAGTDGFIKVFDLAGELREILLEKERESYYFGFNCVAISKSGRWLAAGSGDNLVRIWDLVTGKRAAILQGHVQGVWSVSFSPDDRTLASSTTSQVMFWQVGSWQGLMSMQMNEPIRRTQLSADGRYLAVWERSDRMGGMGTQQARLWSPRIWPAPPLAELDAESEHAPPTPELR